MMKYIFICSNYIISFLILYLIDKCSSLIITPIPSKAQSQLKNLHYKQLYQFILSEMFSKQPQQIQTIEFFKTRLMQRDREISDFETKTKKIQLKHTRDLKEAKIAQERSKNLLKQEKNKADKYFKQLKDSQQQIFQLNTRLLELTKQKEREVNQIKNLYNSMKDQVRKYERILPTLTFLNQFGLSIQNIPPYQDIFISLKEKIVQLQQTNRNFQSYKIKNQEIIGILKQNEQAMRIKKIEIEKNLNQVIYKIQEYQNQNSQLKIIQNELGQKNADLQRLYKSQVVRNSDLQRFLKQYEQKIEELQIFYSNQLQNKEDEIKKIAQDQFSRFENQIYSMENKFQMKQKMYLQQIRILQEEVYFLQGKISQEKNNFQQNYIEIKEQIQKMREQVQQERQAHEQLKERYEQIVRSLIKISRHNDQLEQKVHNQQRKIQIYQEKQRNSLINASDIQISQIRHMQESYDQLLEKYTQANKLINTLKQANSYLQQETATLRSQIVSKTTPECSNTLQLPLSFMHFQNLIKKASSRTQTTKNNQLILQTNNIESIQKNCQNLKIQGQQLNMEVDSLQTQVRSLKQNSTKIQNQLLQQITVNQRISKETISIKNQRDKYFEEVVKLRQKIVQISSQLNQKQKLINQNKINLNLIKNKVLFLQKTQQNLKQKLKQENIIQNRLKQETKQFKDLQISENNQSKIIKELYYQLQVSKAQNDKLRNDFSIRENSIVSEIKKLRVQVDEKTKNTNKKQNIYSQFIKIKEQNLVLVTKINQNQSLKNSLCKDNQALKQEIQKNQRQITQLTQSLSRERKERSLLSVPSLKIFNETIYEQERQKLKALSQKIKSKDQMIHGLQRQIQDLKQQIENFKIGEKVRFQSTQIEQKYYIQQIIQMKMKCAESEMKAAECQYLYNILKRKSSKSIL